MNPNREREEAIFEAAREMTSAKERETFLAKMCGPDGELRKRIESMLEAEAAAGEFFQTRQATAPDAGFANMDSSVLTEKVGDKIGRYKLLQKLGEGGCGVVYMAEQMEPVKRRVAVKVIKLGMDTKAVVARFEAERQALALMDHPHIARVLDAGATDTGRPYFVMELVRGIRITDYCDQANLSTQERLGLFIQICQAVQHAHQKGIIHRDIKPSNILVTVNDGVPVPKVIDFGIAKATTGQQLTDKTLFTAYEQFIGTPAYMSPEQAVMTSLDIDTRTDIYSLGVLLYEMLVARTPFDAQDLLQAGLDEMRRKIREDEPLRPSTRLSTMLAADLTTVAKHHGAEVPALINRVRGDLDWIVMKALEKDRSRRYETANGFALDIQRHLNNEPVVARPPSHLYRLQKFARRNKTAFAASVAVAAALLIGLTVSAWQAIRATRAQRSEEKARLAADQSRARESEQRTLAQEGAHKAIESERITQRLLYAADMKLAHQAWEEGNLSRVHSLLGAHHPKTGEADTRGFEYFCLEELAKGEQEYKLQGHTNPVSSLAVSPDGRWLASRGQTDTRLWDLQQRRQVAVWTSPSNHVEGDRIGFGQGISFSHDSRYLALETEAGLQLCQIATLQTRLLSTGLAEKPIFSPGTNWIAFNSTAAAGFQVKVWDYLSNKLVGTTGPGSYLWCWSADGSKLLTGFSRGQVGHVDWWDISAAKCVATHHVAQYIFGASVSPDGKMTAAADWQGDIWLLESVGGKILGSLPSGDIRPLALAFSPDSRFLATPSRDQAVLVWDLESRKLVHQLRGHEGKVVCLAYGPDGKLLASGGMDGAVMLWDPTRETRQSRIPNQVAGFGLNPPCFSPDGKWLAVSTRRGDYIDILDASNLQTKVTLQGEFASFSSDSTQVAIASGPFEEPTLRVFRIGDSSPRATVLFDSTHGSLREPRMSPDGQYLAAHDGQYESTFLFQAATGERLLTLPGYPPDLYDSCFLPDGRSLVHAHGPHISFWNLQSLKKEFAFDSDSRAVTLKVSPDGRVLAVTRVDFSISLWDLGSRAEIGILSGHQAIVWTLAFSPDGRTLASGSEDRTIKLWDLATRREVASMAQDKAVYWLTFSPDGQTLVSGGIGSYQIWRAPRGNVTALANEAQPNPGDLPTNSIWRLPDGQAPTSPRILADKEHCLTNLLKIHAAIMAYRQDHEQMPDWLTNLIPAYLSDTSLLICPEHARTGGQPVMRTSENYPKATPYYSYQFRAEANTSSDPDGLAAPGDTLKDLRNKQLAFYGDVPVVKCDLHRTSLYVTYSGARMEGTSEEWKYTAVSSLLRKPAELEKLFMKLEEQKNTDRLNDLAYHWATAKNAQERDGKAAVRFAQKAVELTNAKNPNILDTLAAAYAESGVFDEAVRLQLEAISMLKLDSKERQIPEFEARLELYRRHEPCRE